MSDTMRVLAKVPIFSDLDEKELVEIEKIVYRRQYKKGEPIFRMGDPGLGMYIIVEGTVEILEELENEEQKTWLIWAKGPFSEIWLCWMKPRAQLRRSPKSIATSSAFSARIWSICFIVNLNRA
jgi:hypothetical protein